MSLGSNAMVGERGETLRNGAKYYELSRTTNKFAGKIGMADSLRFRGRHAGRADG